MATPPENYLKFTFGAFTLDGRRGTLQKNGEIIKIRAQSFRVLSYLLERHGTLVSKEELHDEIWGDKVVSDDSLTHCLLDIRKCLGDVDKTMIRTVPRRGYLFEEACQQERISASGNTSVSQGFGARKAIVGVVAVAAIVIAAVVWFSRPDATISSIAIPANSVAVMPFADMSETQDQRYLADGVADEILNLLSRSPDLVVTARTSSFSFARGSPDIAAIRELLNVAYVLEGSVRRKQGRLAVTAQLVETATNANVWSQSLEGQPESLGSMQKKIVGEVLDLIAPDADDSIITPAQRSFSAVELMLLARYYEQEVREKPEVDMGMLNEAISLYRDAVDADPFSALAHSRLGSALLYAGDLEAAETSVFKANSLDPNLSEVQQTLGEYFWMRGLPGAGAAWKRAIELNPSNADALSAYAHWYWMQANDDVSEDLFRRALSLDPVSLARHAALGEYLAHQSRVEKVHRVIDRIQGRFDSADSYRVIARLLELVGELDRSIAWTIAARDREPNNPDHVSALAELYAEIGDEETALSLETAPAIGVLFKLRRFDEMIEQAERRVIDENDDNYLRYLLAFSYNAIGKHDVAIRMLRALGQPLAQRSEIRIPVEVEAFVSYVDALDAIGATQQARELAEWFNHRPHTESENWWVHVLMACTQAIAGEEEGALLGLERAAMSPRLPWDTSLQDLRCFERFEDAPRYQAVLNSVKSRRAALRKQLPDTLSDFGVEL